MGWKKAILRTLKLTALFVFILGAFALFSGSIDVASAPFVSRGEPEPSLGELSGAYDPSGGSYTDASPAGCDAPGEPAVPAAPAEPESDYVVIRMDPSAISRGNLILVNLNHRFDPPDTAGFESIADRKTPSYRVTGEDLLIYEPVMAPLNAMMDAFFAETGRDTVSVISAFRGFEAQQQILNRHISRMGSAEALRWAAPPGHSEHHTGLAVDFGFYSGGTLRTFLGTGVYSWFRNNSFEYGFILRFPHDKTAITLTAYEPWHFRYVGQPHAYIIHQRGLCLEEYIEFIADFTRSDPLGVMFRDSFYEVYFTRDMEVFIPFDCEFDISGNNADGFIVTIKR